MLSGLWLWYREKEDVQCYTKCMATVEGILGMPLSSLCSAVCGQDLDCITRKIDGMKGLDEYLIQAKEVPTLKKCEYFCNHLTACKAFRYLPRNSFCFLYSEHGHVKEDISDSSFYIKYCISCSMKSTKNAKGPDDEIQTVWEVPSFKECENDCFKSYRCVVVHFDGKRCFKFNSKVEPIMKTGINFSAKICVMPPEYDGK
ncbi:unnamed protein product [Mytilus coruscus]|uniref:Apple domain-containing protein n=1 Tax=Mytilus coruscus TaxID=42192 RepID=A0A6J8D0L0_MYTCO|nr:unnamed protein product [Mytilus coruscus]